MAVQSCVAWREIASESPGTKTVYFIRHAEANSLYSWRTEFSGLLEFVLPGSEK